MEVGKASFLASPAPTGSVREENRREKKSSCERYTNSKYVIDESPTKWSHSLHLVWCLLIYLILYDLQSFVGVYFQFFDVLGC